MLYRNILYSPISMQLKICASHTIQIVYMYCIIMYVHMYVPPSIMVGLLYSLSRSMI